jgi:hypothetical protein
MVAVAGDALLLVGLVLLAAQVGMALAIISLGLVIGLVIKAMAGE